MLWLSLPIEMFLESGPVEQMGVGGLMGGGGGWAVDAQKDPNRGGSQNPGSPCPGANHSALGAGPKSVSSSCLDGDTLLRAQHPKKTGVPRSPLRAMSPGATPEAPCIVRAGSEPAGL